MRAGWRYPRIAARRDKRPTSITAWSVTSRAALSGPGGPRAGRNTAPSPPGRAAAQKYPHFASGTGSASFPMMPAPPPRSMTAIICWTRITRFPRSGPASAVGEDATSLCCRTQAVQPRPARPRYREKTSDRAAASRRASTENSRSRLQYSSSHLDSPKGEASSPSRISCNGAVRRRRQAARGRGQRRRVMVS